MKAELIQNLALIYVKAHTNEKTSVAEIYEMYKSATNEILKLDSDDMDAMLSSSGFLV